jgi:hypothetical protein
MWDAQAFEHILVTTVVALAGEKGKFQTPGSFESFSEWADQGKLRILVEELRRLGIRIPPGTQQRFKDAIRARNFLAHRFFIKNAETFPFPSPAGAERLLRELKSAKEAIARAQTIIEPINLKLGEKLGLDIAESARRYFARIKRDVTAHQTAE